MGEALGKSRERLGATAVNRDAVQGIQSRGLIVFDGFAASRLGTAIDIDLAEEVDFLLFAHAGCGGIDFPQEGFEVLSVGHLEGMDEEIGLLVTEYVSADTFAEGGGITPAVEPVVLKLEGQSDILSEGVEEIYVLGFAFESVVAVDGELTTDETAHAEGTPEENGCFEPYHSDVLVGSDIGACLEVNVELLSFSDFDVHLVERLDDGTEHRRGDGGYIGVGESLHGVARQNCRIFVPLEVDCGFAVTFGSFVHDVIVEQCEIMVYFEANGRSESRLDIVAEEIGRHQDETGAHAFAAAGEHVLDRIEKVGCQVGVGDTLDGGVDEA